MPREKAVNQVPRVLVVFKVPLVQVEKLAKGVVLELMVPEECQESLVQRVTEDLMVFLASLVTKVTGETVAHRDLLAYLVKMDQEEKMGKLDQEVSQVKLVHGDYWAPEVHLAPLDNLALRVLMDLRAQKETWVLKGSQDLLVSKESQARKGFLVRKVLLDLLEKKDLKASLACLAFLVPMGLLGILEKRVSLERKVHWGLQVLRVQLAIQVLGV